jgi:hypothetical protein
VARWACGAKWAEGLAPQAQCATPLGLSLSEWLGLTRVLEAPNVLNYKTTTHRLTHVGSSRCKFAIAQFVKGEGI